MGRRGDGRKGADEVGWVSQWGWMEADGACKG